MTTAPDHRDKSFWLATHPPYTPSPPVQGDLNVDIAVVGGGFTGLSTAYNLRLDNPGLRVAVLEGEIIGYGASGRNGGFSMTLFGFEPSITKLFFGAQRTVDAQRYMERAVDYVDGLVREHQMQSDYWFPGFLRVATTPSYAKRIQRDLKILSDMGIGGVEWIDAATVRAEVDSPAFLGAWWEPRCGLLNPAKHVRELKRVAVHAGAEVYEHTPVTAISRGTRLTVRTPGGRRDGRQAGPGHQRVLAPDPRSRSATGSGVYAHGRDRAPDRRATRHHRLAQATGHRRRPQSRALLPPDGR